jgi:hypothetical protein
MFLVLWIGVLMSGVPITKLELIMAILTQTNAIGIQAHILRKQVAIVQTKLVILLAFRAVFLTG